MHPNRLVRSQQRRAWCQIRKTDAYAFFDLLKDEGTLNQVESLLPAHRKSVPQAGAQERANQHLTTLYPLPYAAVSRGRQARRGIGTTPIPFRQYMDVLSKSPAPAHGLAGRSPASAKWGGLLFGLRFSWPRKRKVTRAPEAHESCCFWL